MKRLLSLLLALALCLSLVPATAYAEEETDSSEPVAVEEPVENGEPAEDAPAGEPEAPVEALPEDAGVTAGESGACGDSATWTYADGVLTIGGTGAMWDQYTPWSGHSGDITNIIIESGITDIGGYAFFGFDALGTVTFETGSRLTGIGENAFYNCDALTSVAIPSGVTDIGDCAFEECDALTSVTIPAGVTGIGDEAFCHCSALTAINVDPANADYASEDGILLNKAETALLQCPGGRTGCTIPAGVTDIGNSALKDCDLLTSITVPAGVTGIGVYAFCGCTALKTVSFAPGSGLTDIGEYAFEGCTALTDITFTGRAPGFGDGCFYGVTATVHYPASESNWTTDVMRDYGGRITWAADGLTITAQPRSATVLLNGTARFTVAAVGTGLSYRWQYCRASGTVWTDCSGSGCSTVSYSVQATAARSGMKYRVIVTDSCGRTMTSDTAVLHVDSRPVITGLTNNTAGITVRWKAVSGVESYDIYRSKNGGGYSMLKNVKAGAETSYTDVNVSNGAKYTYRITARMTDSGRTVQSDHSAAKTIYRLERPTISHINCVSDGIKIEWYGNGGATGVRIYRSDNGGELKLVNTVSDRHSGSWVDPTANVNGVKYQYKLVYYKNAGTSVFCSAGRTATRYYLSSSTLLASANRTGVTLVWFRNNEVTGYKLYRSTDNRSFELAGRITDPAVTRWTDEAVTAGTKYYYKMVGYVKVNSNVYNGAFSGTRTVTAK